MASSRNDASFAVALNCGIGSSSLKADVKAFDRLQIVRDRNSSYLGLRMRTAACASFNRLPFSMAVLALR